MKRTLLFSFFGDSLTFNSKNNCRRFFTIVFAVGNSFHHHSLSIQHCCFVVDTLLLDLVIPFEPSFIPTPLLATSVWLLISDTVNSVHWSAISTFVVVFVILSWKLILILLINQVSAVHRSSRNYPLSFAILSLRFLIIHYFPDNISVVAEQDLK
jgi:hypothetical protein